MPRNHIQIAWSEVMAAVAERGASLSSSSKRLYVEGKNHADDQYFSGIPQFPVMIVAETEEGVLLELSLDELAEVYELLPPALWRTLVQHYQIFHVV